ncbi:MAG: cohesin domain-containing protein [Propionivibrio sp.]
MSLFDEGKAEAGIAALEKAVAAAPTNGAFRKDLYLRKAAYIDQLLTVGETKRLAGDLTAAESAFNKVLMLEPANARSRAGLEGLVRDRRHEEAVVKAKAAAKVGDLDKAVQELRPVLLENPDLVSAQQLKREIGAAQNKRQTTDTTLRTQGKPVNFEFRDANVKMVFEALSRSTGINFILDKDIRPDLRTSIFLKKATIEDALDLILQTSQLQKKILNSNTVLIYANSPEKLKEYQDLIVKTFYLQNADVKQVQNTLKTLLKIKDIVIDEKLNLLMIRDTPEAVRLSEKIVETHDAPEPEVMLDVEVLEVQRSQLYDLGIQWPTEMSLMPLSSSGDTLTMEDLSNLNKSRIGVTIGKTKVNIKQDLSDANLLANPRIRVRNREKAKVMVGDKIPIVTATSTATGFVSDSVQYMDVGLKVELEPDIRLQGDVAIKVGLEVSSLGNAVTTTSGTLAYQVGTRNAATVLRLRDGETQILAGLLSDEERSSGLGVPGLAKIPLVGRLFGSRQDSQKKTEIVLSITPRLIRNLQRPDAEQSEFWSGSESTLRTEPISLRSKNYRDDQSSDSETAGKPPLSNLPDEPGAPAQKVALSWNGPTKVKPGEQFKLELKLKADGILRSLPLQAVFDPAVFQVVQISEGDFFKQNDATSSFSSNVDAESGKFYVSASCTSASGVDGEGVAAALTLRALTASSKSDIALTAVSPIADGGKTPATPLPAPHSIIVEP